MSAIDLPPAKHELGLVQVYTGDGKGKTTAALGLALRAAGWGFRSYIGQFMKGRDYGELHSVARLSPLITIEPFGQPGFVRAGEIAAEDVALVARGLERVQAVLAAGEHQIVVLDEICMAVFFGLTPLQAVLELVAGRPAGVELVLTGRRAPQALIDVADLVTEMVEIKHPYQRGVGARRGVEL